MKPQLKEVYLLTGKIRAGNCYIPSTDDYVDKKEMIVFTIEEYNQHLKDIIETIFNSTDNKKETFDKLKL